MTSSLASLRAASICTRLMSELLSKRILATLGLASAVMLADAAGSQPAYPSQPAMGLVVVDVCCDASWCCALMISGRTA